MASENICPGLYRDEKGKFYCAYAGGIEVDPAFMPCLAEYWECPYYIGHKEKEKAEEEAEEAAPQVVEEAPAESAAVEVQETVEATTPEAAETGITVETAPVAEEKADVLGEIDSIAERAISLNDLWEKYDREARSLIEAWEEVRENAEKIVLSLQQSIDTYLGELSKLEVKHRIGVIKDDVYEELRSELERKIAEKRELQESIVSKINEVERLILPHFKRVKVSEAKPEIAKLRLALSKLEEMYKTGQISEDTYRKLKNEIEEKIRKLERVKEEVE